jgi:hypothetical protein
MLLPSVFSIAPLPSGVVGIAATVLQVAAMCVSYKAERTSPSEYSKFARLKEDTLKNPIPSHVDHLYSGHDCGGSLHISWTVVGVVDFHVTLLSSGAFALDTLF